MILFFKDLEAARSCAEKHNGEVVIYPSADYEVYTWIAKDGYNEDYAKEYPYAVYYCAL